LEVRSKNLLKIFFFKFETASFGGVEESVEFVGVALVVFVDMKIHGSGINVGLEGVEVEYGFLNMMDHSASTIITVGDVVKGERGKKEDRRRK
jgi:hypothetical protein